MEVFATDEYKYKIGNLKGRTGQDDLVSLCGLTVPFTATLVFTEISMRGVCELKIDVGPGYRVYSSFRGDQLLLLLAGGNKATQNKDIEKALELNRVVKDVP